MLLAAGIEARLPAALPALADEVSELFGYVVREAVTNVVRHARRAVHDRGDDGPRSRCADDGVGRSGTDRSGRA